MCKSLSAKKLKEITAITHYTYQEESILIHTPPLHGFSGVVLYFAHCHLDAIRPRTAVSQHVIHLQRVSRNYSPRSTRTKPLN